MLAWLLLVVTANAAPRATPPRGDAHYDVVVVAGIGTQRVEETRTLHTTRTRSRTWTINRVHTQGTWEDVTGATEFDSDNIAPGSPWPLVTEHTVASVPVQVRFDRAGHPVAVAAPETWRQTAEQALAGLSLPAAGRHSGASFIDVTGRLTELARVFIGIPEDDWSRPDIVAGVEVTREESCTSAHEGGLTTWTCRGTATSASQAVQDVETWTHVVTDRKGLVSVEEGWSGTLIHLSVDGRTPMDSPIGGRRLVQRR